MDTGLLRSTKELGRGRETRKERVRRAVREVKAGVAGEESLEVVFEERVIRDPTELEVAISPTVEPEEAVKVEVEAKVEKGDMEKLPVAPAIAVGSGLKRPLGTDENGFPIIKRVKKSVQVRQERLMEMIRVMEGEVGGSGSEDEDGSGESDESVESEDEDEDEEEWGGIADDIDAVPNYGDSAEEGAGSNESGEEDEEHEDEAESSGSEGYSSEEGSEGEEGGGEGDKPVSRLRRGQSERANAFKAWALAQRKQVLNGGEPEHSMPNLLELKPKVVAIPKTAPAPPPSPPGGVKKVHLNNLKSPPQALS